MHIETMSYVVQCVCSDMLARVLKISLPINGRELRGAGGEGRRLDITSFTSASDTRIGKRHTRDT